MTIDQLGNIGELVAALATVATLLYLAVQLRHNTVSTRANVYQELLAQRATVNLTLASREIAPVWRKGLWEPQLLTADEAMQFSGLTLQIMAYLRAGQKLHTQGVLDDSDLNEMLEIAGVLKSCSGFLPWWEVAQGFYDPSFRNLVERTPPSTGISWDDVAKRRAPTGTVDWRAAREVSE